MDGCFSPPRPSEVSFLTLMPRASHTAKGYTIHFNECLSCSNAHALLFGFLGDCLLYIYKLQLYWTAFQLCRLLPALLRLGEVATGAPGRTDAMRYVQFCIRRLGSTDAAIHNLAVRPSLSSPWQETYTSSTRFCKFLPAVPRGKKIKKGRGSIRSSKG